MLAAQALTVQAAVGNRLTLGIGAGIGRMVSSMYALPTDRAARRLREYLEVLRPLLRGEPVDHNGGYCTAAGAEAPPVLIAALGPAMLKVAGELADGTITWMTGPRTLSNHVAPSIIRASGSRTPRIVAGLLCVSRPRRTPYGRGSGSSSH